MLFHRRNLVCIGCGCPRSNNNGLHAPLPYSLPVSSGGPRTALSPRFASQNGSYSPQPIPQGYPCPTPPVTTTTPLGALQKPAHPLLTPSGRAFAIGGRVQNISCDPLTPCIMYWPDNEPLPDQGQIRPGGLVGLNHPPILNTGNRGPISHQPGDWICKKCNYLNWRRRKVCQTCLPYAEGNGDSISTAIQAERITLLTTVLAQSHLSDAGNATPLQVIRPHSSTPPRAPESPPGLLLPTTSFHRSQSYVELTSPQYTTHHPSFAHARPIYQTSGHHRQPSPLYTTGPEILVHAPAPLLPSFLQDMVQSPTLSPSSTSSADLSSFEEDTDTITHVSDRKGEEADSPSSSPSGNNIWRLDVEESRSLNVYALQNRQDLGGFARKTSLHAMHLVR
ncbi:hypothetical protein APHAL10511_000868 [Amanita phalloides]|nr:hypothetical protein APHAL10511_000868 [Amanita phalloides]